MKQTPSISICIPVKNTEPVLQNCLDSILQQEYKDLEIIIINDNSTAKDSRGWKCKKIIRHFQRTSKIPITYIEHYNYVPLTETRRELIEQARGEYILMVDSDDLLAPNALNILYEAAKKSGADITCGQDRIFEIKENNQTNFKENMYAVHYTGTLTNREIFDSWLIKQNSSGFLWAKLIKRELYLKAYNAIPYIDCSVMVDVAIYFFLAFYAKSYFGINDVVYYYCYNTGITSSKPIKTLKEWERYCTAASNYTIMFQLQDKLTPEEMESLRKLSRKALYSCMTRLKTNVDKSLYPQAYEMLCEYWGREFVQNIEKMMDKS